MTVSQFELDKFISQPKFFALVGVFFVFDLLSALAYFFPVFGNLVFFIFILGALALSIRRLEYGLFLVFTELFLGSKGYLFSFEYGTTVISLRLALFIVVTAVYLAKFLLKSGESQINQGDGDPTVSHHEFPTDRGHGDLKYDYFSANWRTITTFVIFGNFILYGIINGLIRGNGFNNVFLDANAYFFFLLIFPVWHTLKAAPRNAAIAAFLGNLKNLLFAAASWLSLKTIILFTAFTYASGAPWLRNLYLWVRNTVGEVTPFGDAFFRIFIQSQLYIVIAFLLLLAALSNSSSLLGGRRGAGWLLGSLYLSAILISLSRSFWVGLAAAIFVYFLSLAVKRKWAVFFRSAGNLIIMSVFALLLLGAISLPAISRVGERAREFTAEPAIEARAAQLRPLIKEILKNPMLGSGFGTMVTYKTSDPRLLKSNPSGKYTTYAFELGYLDIALKLGLLGLAVYLFLIFKIARNLGDQKELLLGLIALLVINIFSPYLNHPLGIGYLLLLVIWQNEKPMVRMG